MDESYSRLLGSVPAVISDDRKATNYEATDDLQVFPPPNAGSRGKESQAPGTSSGAEGPSENRWKGVFNISTYTPYFDVDTDTVVDRLAFSLNPLHGNFFSRIYTIPDLYGPIWITATLIVVLTVFGNCATYLMDKQTSSSTSWSFDVGYLTVATAVLYGYLILVPVAFFFLYQYYGMSPSLVRLWCMWGYSLSIFLPTCLLLIIPVEVLRWIIIILVGAASGYYVALNLRSYMEGNNDLMILVVAAFVLQFGLALFIKIYFYA